MKYRRALWALGGLGLLATKFCGQAEEAESEEREGGGLGNGLGTDKEIQRQSDGLACEDGQVEVAGNEERAYGGQTRREDGLVKGAGTDGEWDAGGEWRGFYEQAGGVRGGIANDFSGNGSGRGQSGDADAKGYCRSGTRGFGIAGNGAGNDGFTAGETLG